MTRAEPGVLAEESAGSVGCKRMQLRSRKSLRTRDCRASRSWECLIQSHFGPVGTTITYTVVIAKMVVKRIVAEGFDALRHPGADFYGNRVTVFGIALSAGAGGHARPHTVALTALVHFRPDHGIGEVGSGGALKSFMHGIAEEADLERVRRAGFAAHLIKPVDPQDLLASVRA